MQIFNLKGLYMDEPYLVHFALNGSEYYCQFDCGIHGWWARSSWPCGIQHRQAIISTAARVLVFPKTSPSLWRLTQKD